MRQQDIGAQHCSADFALGGKDGLVFQFSNALFIIPVVLIVSLKAYTDWCKAPAKAKHTEYGVLLQFSVASKHKWHQLVESI